jgi:elongator complex protein 2
LIIIQFYCLHTLVGHEDWIRDLDICQTNENQLLIASSSQDNYIRLWKLDSNIINDKEISNLQKDNTELLIKSKNDQEDIEDDEDDEISNKKQEKIEEELKLKSSLFKLYSKSINRYVQYSINLESVLYGHEDWIYTVKFHPKMSHGQPLILLSASMDKTLVVWKYDQENSIWIDQSRVGDIGGNTLGFYGAAFEPNGKYIVAHGYQGALHLWKREINNESKVFFIELYSI